MYASATSAKVFRPASDGLIAPPFSERVQTLVDHRAVVVAFFARCLERDGVFGGGAEADLGRLTVADEAIDPAASCAGDAEVQTAAVGVPAVGSRFDLARGEPVQFPSNHWLSFRLACPGPCSGPYFGARSYNSQ
jgi:hypothetical protein